jgi:hypothetical protein
VAAAVRYLLFTQVEEESVALNRGLLDVLKVLAAAAAAEQRQRSDGS